MIQRTDPSRIVEKVPNPTTATDTIMCNEGDVVVMFQQGQMTNIAGPGHYNAPAAGLEAFFVKSTPIPGIKAGGTVGTIMDRASKARVSPRVFGDYVLQVTDATKLITQFVNTNSPDDEGLKRWVGSQIVNASKFHVATAPLAETLADATGLSEKVRAEANEKVGPMGVSIVQLSLNVSLSDEDRAAIQAG